MLINLLSQVRANKDLEDYPGSTGRASLGKEAYCCAFVTFSIISWLLVALAISTNVGLKYQ
jgi:hypothetical protein